MHLRWLSNEVPIALMRTFIARCVSVLGTLLLAAVIGRFYGPSGLGVFALAQMVVLGASRVAQYGMGETLLRYVGRDRRGYHVRVYLVRAVRKAGELGIVLAIGVFFARQLIEQLFGAPQLVLVLRGISCAIPAFTLTLVLVGFMKAIRKPASASLLENGSVSLVTATIVLVVHSLSLAGGIAVAGWAFAAAAWLVLAPGLWQAWRWVNGRQCTAEPTEQPVSMAEFARTSRAFLVNSMAGMMQRVGLILVAGVLLSNRDLGLFRSAQQAGMLIAFVLVVVNAVLPARFATLHHQGQISVLQRLARRGALTCFTFAAPFLVLCLAVPGTVLAAFGPGFAQAAPLLRIIAAAQIVNVTLGSTAFLLNMTGLERLMRNITVVCNGIGILLVFVLTPLLGTIGAALSLAFMIVTRNLAALAFVWRKLGIWPLPTPNLLRWMPTEEPSTR